MRRGDDSTTNNMCELDSDNCIQCIYNVNIMRKILAMVNTNLAVPHRRGLYLVAV